MPSKDPDTRRAAASAGGAARSSGDSDALRTMRQAGAAAVNSPAGLARRLDKAWPTMDRKQRAEVRKILAVRVAPGAARQRTADDGQGA